MVNLASEMKKIDEDVYYLPAATNVGVIQSINNDGVTELYLVDSGTTSLDGEAVLNVINKNFSSVKFIIKAIITTHAHPDHFGGHSYIKEKTGCKVLATKTDIGCMENPLLHSTVIWGGYPPHGLRSAYFNPPKVSVDEYIYEGKVINLSNNKTISFIDVPGHTYSSLGIIVTYKDTNKKIIFTGDSIFTKEELGKFWIPFLVNPDEFVHSIEKLLEIENVMCFVPSHGQIIDKEKIEDTADWNMISVYSAKKSILDALDKKEFSTIDEITKSVADQNEYRMSLGQYTLMNSTIKSYLAVMNDNKEVTMTVTDNVLYFSKSIKSE